MDAYPFLNFETLLDVIPARLFRGPVHIPPVFVGGRCLFF